MGGKQQRRAIARVRGTQQLTSLRCYHYYVSLLCIYLCVAFATTLLYICTRFAPRDVDDDDSLRGTLTMTERLSETEKPGSFPGNPSAAVTIWSTRIVSFLLCIYVCVCVAFNRSTTKEEEEEEEEAVVTL